MSDVTNYRVLLGRYIEASGDFAKSIPDDVIEESDGAAEALHEMAKIAVEAMLLRMRELR